SVGAWFSQLLIWPIATFRLSSALACDVVNPTATMSGNALAHNVSLFISSSSRTLFAPLVTVIRLTSLPQPGGRECGHRGGIPPLLSRRITQYSQARADALGPKLMALAISVSPGVNRLTDLSIFAVI